MKIRLTAQIVDDNGEELAGIVTKEAEVPNVTAYGNKEQFLELFHRYETAVIRERESLTADVTKEYLDCAADLKKRKSHEIVKSKEILRGFW